MASERAPSSSPPFWKSILVGIIILVVGGIILAYLKGWLLQDRSNQERPQESSSLPETQQSSPTHTEATTLRPESAVEGNVNVSGRNSTFKNHQSWNEVAKVRINRAFEDYDSAISELKRDFKESSERIASQFSKRRMLASGAFIKAQMDLSVATKQKVYQKFVELDRSIQDILIKVFGKTSLAAMGKELDEELNRFNEKKAQLKEIYLMLENHPKDWELRVIGEHRATKGFDLTNDL